MNVKAYRYLSIFLLFLGIVTSCSLSIESSSVRKLSKVEKSFSKINTTVGQRDVSIKMKEKVWNMRVNFPKSSLAKKPLVIALHWAGGGYSFKVFSKCLAEPGLSKLNAIIITPDAEHQVWINKYNEERIVKLVELALKFWNIDTSKVLVTGYSNGGVGSWFFADKYPELFTAAIPIASMYEIDKKIQIPMYVIHGKNDALFKVQKIAACVESAKQYGSNIKFVINPELSHYEACAYVDELKKASEWVLDEVWQVNANN